MPINEQVFYKFDLNSLVTFLVIYQQQGVSRAARRLNVTQPAVSNALGKLRMHFDDPLFVPCGRQLCATAKAERIARALAPAMCIVEAVIAGRQAGEKATAWLPTVQDG